MRKFLSALLCALVALSGVPVAHSATRPVRATASPPTVGAACDTTYENSLIIDISNGDQFYCNAGLWAKRTAGGSGGEWVEKGIDTDGDGTDAAVEFNPTTDELWFNLTESAMTGTRMKLYQNRLHFSADTKGGLIFDQMNGTGLFTWKLCSAVITLMYDEDADGTVDANDYCYGNGGPDLDCDCTADSSGSVTQVDIDGDGTREISLASGVMTADPDEDGSPELTIDTSANQTSSDPDGDGSAELTIDASANTISLNPAGDSSAAWKFCEDTPTAGEVAYYDSTAGCWKADSISNITQGRPYNYVELWEDFVEPRNGNSFASHALNLHDDSTNSISQAIFDQDGTVGEAGSAIGVLRATTGTTNNNDGWIGFSTSDGAEPTSLVASTFQVKKARLFRARWENNFIDAAENAQLAVGGIGETEGASVSVAPDNKETGVYFFCNPDADQDDDGTAGDAEDDNVWAVVDNNLGIASDTTCLINGTGACTPDANRQAADTGIECTDASYFLVGEIEHDGAGGWTFRLDNDADQSAWDYTGTFTAVFADLSSVALWGAALRNDNQAFSKSVSVDYFYYYGIRY